MNELERLLNELESREKQENGVLTVVRIISKQQIQISQQLVELQNQQNEILKALAQEPNIDSLDDSLEKALKPFLKELKDLPSRF